MNRLLGLLLAIIPTLGLSGPMDNLTPGRWTIVSSNTMKDVDPCPANNCSYSDGGHQAGVLDDWSSTAFASGYGSKGSLLAWGGGHLGYFGNEVYAFDLATGLWSRITDPSTDVTTTFAGDKCTRSTGSYPDGKPCSVHTYDSLVYNTVSNEFVVVGMADDYIGGGMNGYAWTLKLSNLTWRRSTSPGEYNGSAGREGSFTGYDPTRGLIWQLATGDLHLQSFDTTANSGGGQWLSYAPKNIGGSGTGRVDPVHDIFVVFDGQHSSIIAFDLKNPNVAPVNITTTGDASIVQSTYGAGFEWDSVANKFVAWSDDDPVKTNVYTLTVPTNWKTQPWIWTKITAAAGGATPTAPTNHTFGKFRYVPVYDAFIMVNKNTGPVWAYKLDPLLDFQARCATPGVFICNGFDQASDITTSGNRRYATGNNSTPPALDTSIKASGASSLEFTIPAVSSRDNGGLNYFWSPGTVEGQTIYYQYRYRIDPNMTQCFHNDSGLCAGWKQIIFHAIGDSCDQIEETTKTLDSQPAPEMYRACGQASIGHSVSEPLHYANQSGDYNCYYGNHSHGDLTGCFVYPTNQWMTFEVQTTVGHWGQPDTIVKGWVAIDGQQPKLYMNETGITFNHNNYGPQEFSQIDLTNYISYKNETETKLIAHSWFDELIVSTQYIPWPGVPATQTQVPVTAILTSSQPSYTTSQAVILTWTCGGPADSAVASGSWSGTKTPTAGGTADLGTQAAATYTYIITCADSVGGTSQAATVVVPVATPSYPVVTFTSAQTSLSTGVVLTPSFPLSVNLFTGVFPETAVSTVTLDSAPTDTVTITVTGFDIENLNEGFLDINGNGQITLFGRQDDANCNDKTCSVSFTTVPGWWVAGTNTLTWHHTSSYGFRISQVDLNYITASGDSTADLTWTVSNATSCAASASPTSSAWTGAKAFSGTTTASVGPFVAGTTILTLDCVNSGLHTIRTIPIDVGNPVTASLVVPPPPIYTTDALRFQWSSDGDSCTAGGSPAPAQWSGARPTSGFQIIGGQSAGTYNPTLTCIKGAASTTVTAPFTVLQPNLASVVLQVNPTTGIPTTPITATWNARNVLSCTTVGDCWTPGTVAASGVQTFTCPVGTNNLGISCANQFNTASDIAHVVIDPSPMSINKFTASPTSVNLGGTSTLTWNVTNAASCGGQNGAAGDPWNGKTLAVTAGDHTQVTVSLTASATYTLRCVDSQGTPIVALVGVGIAVGQTKANLSSSAIFVKVNDTPTITYKCDYSTTAAWAGSYSGFPANNTLVADGQPHSFTAPATTAGFHSYGLTCTDEVNSVSNTQYVIIATQLPRHRLHRPRG